MQVISCHFYFWCQPLFVLYSRTQIDVTRLLGFYFIKSASNKIISLKGNLIFFFFLSFLSVFSAELTKDFFFCILDWLLLQADVTCILGHTGEILCGKCLINLKFCVWEHYMPSALEKIIMMEVNWPTQWRISNGNMSPHLQYLQHLPM